MPMIDLTMPRDALTADGRAKVVEGLTAALLKWEGAPDNKRSRSVSWLFVDERPLDAIQIGGRPAQMPVYRILITTPTGTPGLSGPYNEGRRREMVREVTELVLSAEGVPYEPENVARVWCHFHEVPETHWGAAGTIAQLKDIGAFVGSATPTAPFAPPEA